MLKRLPFKRDNKEERVKRNFNKDSIKVKLLVIPLIMVIVSMLIIGVIIGKKTQISFQNEMGENSHFLLHNVTERLADNERSLEIINESLEIDLQKGYNFMKSLGGGISNESLTQLAGDLEADQLNYWGEDGVIVYSNIPENIGYDPSNEENHPMTAFINSGETELMEDIRLDTVSNTNSKYGAIKNSDGTILQVGANADHVVELLDELSYQTLMEELSVNEEIVYASFIDTNFNIVADSNTEDIGTDLSEDEAAISAIRDGVPYSSTYNYDNGKTKTNVYDVAYPVVVDGKNLGAINLALSMEEVNSAIWANVRTIVIAGILAILVLGFTLFSTSNYMVTIINRFKDQMNAMASGDFTNEVPEEILNNKDEFGEIAQSVHGLSNSLREILGTINTSAHNLTLASNELATISQDSSANMEEISASTEQISASIQEVSASTEEISASSEEMNAASNQLVENMQDGNESAQEIEERAKNIQAEVIEHKQKSNDTHRNLEARLQEGIENAKVVSEIANMADQISDIAEQTNLLALNAAIESARAGEHGRGFAVVAEEVRKLANDSQATVANIQNVTGQVQTNIYSLIDDANELLRFLSTDIEEDYQYFIETAEQYSADAHTFFNLTDQTSHMGEEVLNAVNEVTISINEVSQTMEQSAQGAGEIANGTANTSSALVEINEASDQLKSMADELETIMTRFKI